ncbi:L-methionine/branched-chain amino acid transporter [Pontibacterium sp.]|uniref:L-methionine/branched-chain amino acid transporter n=1 Tax=Pontibacterium sp. TaxID=2036026 RepID=UPI003515F146
MTRLNQTITRWQGMGLIATTLLGTGVFIIPQLTIQQAGDRAFWAWVILLGAILPLAYVFAELGRKYSHAAGPAYFVGEAFGQTAGRVVGLLFLFAVPPGAAAALIMTFKFLDPIISLTAQQLIGIELLVFMTLFFLNRRGLKLSGRLQLGLTLIILAVVVLMLGAALLTTAAPAEVKAGTSDDVLAAIGLAIWSFLGIEAITHLATEFKDVKRDFIPATLGGVALVGLIFIGCTYLSLLAPDHELAMVGAFELLLGESGRWIIGALGLISGLATINVYFASLSRLAWSFSNEGVLPAQLKPLNKHQVPAAALLAFMLISALILVTSFFTELDFAVLAHWVNGVFVLIYGAAMFAAWKLLSHRHRPAIAVGLAACALFVYSLGSSMLYAVLLSIVISSALLIQQHWRKRDATVVSRPL